MADVHTLIKRYLKEIVGESPGRPFRGTVKAIDGQTCTVTIVGGLEVSGVKLKATVSDAENYILVTPAIGSDVLMVSDTGTADGLTVVQIDEPKKIEIKYGGLTFLLDDDKKVTIKNNDASMIDVLDDVAKIIKELKVYTAMGPSGTPLPDNIAAVTQWQLKYKKLFK